MRIEPVNGVLLGAAPAVRDYVAGTGPVYERFPYHPYQQESYVRRQHEVAEAYPGDRGALSELLLAYNRQIGADAGALANAERLARPDSLAVVTGQQAGAATGPLYTIYKAICAIHLAREQEQALGVPVIPVFWVAGEDHDFQEIALVEFPSADGWTRLHLQGEPEGRVSVGHLPVGPAVDALLAALGGALPDTEFKAGVLADLTETARAAGNLADWFAGFMARLFRGTGLVFISSTLPGLRTLQVEFLVRALERWEAVGDALGQGIGRWQALGYAPTVERQPGAVNLYLYLDGQRSPLVGRGERIWVRDRPEQAWSRQELIALARQEPHRFSTNVVLRPVGQGWALPDLAYVAGPGEIQYFGLYREVFGLFGRELPVIYPRTSLTLLEPALERYLHKQNLAIDDVLFRLEEKRQELLDQADELGLDQLFGRFRQEVGERYDRLVEALFTLDPSLKAVAAENRRQVFRQFDILEEKARQAHRKNNEVALRRFERLEQNLRPRGDLQERVANLTYFLCKFGPDLVSRLTAELPLRRPWVHLVVHL